MNPQVLRNNQLLKTYQVEAWKYQFFYRKGLLLKVEETYIPKNEVIQTIFFNYQPTCKGKVLNITATITQGEIRWKEFFNYDQDGNLIEYYSAPSNNKDFIRVYKNGKLLFESLNELHRFHIRNSASDYLTACLSKSFDLPKTRFDISRIRIAHRLDQYGITAADDPVAAYRRCVREFVGE